MAIYTQQNIRTAGGGTPASDTGGNLVPISTDAAKLAQIKDDSESKMVAIAAKGAEIYKDARVASQTVEANRKLLELNRTTADSIRTADPDDIEGIVNANIEDFKTNVFNNYDPATRKALQGEFDTFQSNLISKGDGLRLGKVKEKYQLSMESLVLELENTQTEAMLLTDPYDREYAMMDVAVGYEQLKNTFELGVSAGVYPDLKSAIEAYEITATGLQTKTAAQAIKSGDTSLIPYIESMMENENINVNDRGTLMGGLKGLKNQRDVEAREVLGSDIDTAMSTLIDNGGDPYAVGQSFTRVEELNTKEAGLNQQAVKNTLVSSIKSHLQNGTYGNEKEFKEYAKLVFDLAPKNSHGGKFPFDKPAIIDAAWNNIKSKNKNVMDNEGIKLADAIENLNISAPDGLGVQNSFWIEENIDEILRNNTTINYATENEAIADLIIPALYETSNRRTETDSLQYKEIMQYIERKSIADPRINSAIDNYNRRQVEFDRKEARVAQMRQIAFSGEKINMSVQDKADLTKHLKDTEGTQEGLLTQASLIASGNINIPYFSNQITEKYDDIQASGFKPLMDYIRDLSNDGEGNYTQNIPQIRQLLNVMGGATTDKEILMLAALAGGDKMMRFMEQNGREGEVDWAEKVTNPQRAFLNIFFSQHEQDRGFVSKFVGGDDLKNNYMVSVLDGLKYRKVINNALFQTENDSSTLSFETGHEVAAILGVIASTNPNMRDPVPDEEYLALLFSEGNMAKLKEIMKVLAVVPHTPNGTVVSTRYVDEKLGINTAINKKLIEEITNDAHPDLDDYSASSFDWTVNRANVLSGGNLIAGLDYDNMMILDMPDIESVIQEGFTVVSYSKFGGEPVPWSHHGKKLVAIPLMDGERNASGNYGYGIFELTEGGINAITLNVSDGMGEAYPLVRDGVASMKLLGTEGASQTDTNIPGQTADETFINNRYHFEHYLDVAFTKDAHVTGIRQGSKRGFITNQDRLDDMFLQQSEILRVQAQAIIDNRSNTQ